MTLLGRRLIFFVRDGPGRGRPATWAILRRTNPSVGIFLLREALSVLVKEVHVHKYKSDVGRNAERESAEMQSRVYRAAITDAC